MLVERVKYKDFDGNEREENFYFNFTEAELTEMELSTKGGLKNEIQRIMDSQDQSEIIKIFKNLLLTYKETILSTINNITLIVSNSYIVNKDVSSCFKLHSLAVDILCILTS